MYLVSGSRPRLPTMITLFTDAISYLPGYQFAHPAFVPLAGHHLEPRNALLAKHFRLAYAAHAGECFSQTLEIHPRCDAKREPREPVDRTRRRPHARPGRQPQAR